jgi:uncharacterized protein involved in exopolysaccharide biosynthesis
MSAFHRRPSSGNAVGGLLGSIWRSKRLIAAAVLLGALVGYGWAARQPTRYEGVARVFLVAGSDRTSLPGEGPQPPWDHKGYLRQQSALLGSPAVLERAVRLSGSGISVETLRQRLEVDAAQDAALITIRVADSTARGAAKLADAVMAAYDAVLAQQLQDRLREMEAEGHRPTHPPLAWERAAVPTQPITPGPGRAMAIGMLLGLLASAVLVWWRTRGQGPTSRSSAPEQGPKIPSPA